MQCGREGERERERERERQDEKEKGERRRDRTAITVRIQFLTTGHNVPTQQRTPHISPHSTIVHTHTQVISDEIRAFGNSNGHRDYQSRPIGVSAWGPNLNIYRDPRWGRNVEVPSEDPFHR